MIVLCININTRGERMVPTYEGGGALRRLWEKNLRQGVFGTLNRARSLIFFLFASLSIELVYALKIFITLTS